MTKIPFNIMYRPQIESGKFKVVTADGRPVTIQRWDMKGDYPILACIIVKQYNRAGTASWDEERPFAYDKNGHATGNTCKLDLFLISEDPGLTEFEETLKGIVNGFGGDVMTDEGAKNSGARLFEVARKQFEKNLPHWKKTNLPDGIDYALDEAIFSFNGYSISINELEKLPKED